MKRALTNLRDAAGTGALVLMAGAWSSGATLSPFRYLTSSATSRSAPCSLAPSSNRLEVELTTRPPPDPRVRLVEEHRTLRVV